MQKTYAFISSKHLYPFNNQKNVFFSKLMGHFYPKKSKINILSKTCDFDHIFYICMSNITISKNNVDLNFNGM